MNLRLWFEIPPQATRPAAGATAGATLMPMVINAQMTAAKADAIWLREVEFILKSFSAPLYATSEATGTTAGATLMPTVMNAQNTAAKIEATWLREERVILNSFVIRRTIPAMPRILHRPCQFNKRHIKQIYKLILSIQPLL